MEPGAVADECDERFQPATPRPLSDRQRSVRIAQRPKTVRYSDVLLALHGEEGDDARWFHLSSKYGSTVTPTDVRIETVAAARHPPGVAGCLDRIASRRRSWTFVGIRSIALIGAEF